MLKKIYIKDNTELTEYSVFGVVLYTTIKPVYCSLSTIKKVLEEAFNAVIKDKEMIV